MNLVKSDRKSLNYSTVTIYQLPSYDWGGVDYI